MKSDLQELAETLERAVAEGRARENPPGDDEIRYRHADYHRFRSVMIEGLGLVQVNAAGPGTPSRPLAGANRDPQTDWMIALIDAWAVVGDIVMFYQERVANEGYVATAREPFSLEQLVRALGARRGGAARSTAETNKPVSPTEPPATVTIIRPAPVVPSQLGPAGPVVPTPGASTAVPLPAPPTVDQPYEMVVDPGAAAITDVSFQLVPHQVTGGRALIRAGTAIRSHRVDGSMPVVFETGADLEARIEYNAMSPATSPAQIDAVITRSSVGLLLRGTATGLRAGSSMLVTGDLVQESGASVPTWLFGTLVTVEPNQALGNTLVTWVPVSQDGESGGLLNQASLGDGTLESLQVWSFGRALTPFGSTAKPLSQAPVATQIAMSTGGGVWSWSPDSKEWICLLDGLPSRSISALSVGVDGSSWIGGAFGAAGLASGATGGWTVQNGGLGSAEIISFTVGEDGSIWCGSTNGQVFRTSGLGRGWSAISGSFMLIPGDNGNQVPFKTALPRTPIAAIQAYIPPAPVPPPPAGTTPQPPPAAAVAGTGLGVFGNELSGNGWLTDNGQLTTSTSKSATSPYTQSPLVDLCVLPGSALTSPPNGGYAIAASSDSLVAFQWYPFDKPSASSSGATGSSPPSNEAPVPSLPPTGPITAPPGQILQATFITVSGTLYLLVLTTEGPYVWMAPSQGGAGSGQTTSDFVAVNTGLDEQVPVQRLAAVPAAVQSDVGGAAVANDGTTVWVLQTSGVWTWVKVPGFEAGPADAASPSLPSIATLVAAGPTGNLLASAPLVPASGWPGFVVVNSEDDEIGNTASAWIDADSKPFDVAPGSWVVVTTNTQARVLSLQSTLAAYRDGDEAFGQPGRVFRLFVRDTPLSPPVTDTFDPQTSQVLAKSAALAAYVRVDPDMRPVWGSNVEIAGIIDGLDQASSTSQGPEGRALAFTGQRARLCVTMTAGLWTAPAAATTAPAWQELGFGFAGVTAVLPFAGELWVGTTSQGVLARTSRGTWENRSAGLAATGQSPPSIAALAGGSQGVIVAAGKGAFRWDASTSVWNPITGLAGTSPASLAAQETPGGTTFWAGTAASGLFTSIDGVTFTQVLGAADLIGVALRALALIGDTLFIGTPQGVYRYGPNGGQLTLIAPYHVTSLAVSGTSLLVGTDDSGVVLVEEAATKPDARAAGLAAQRIGAVASGAGRWFAGTSSEGVYSSADGTTWLWMPIGVADEVLALAVDPSGNLYAGAAEGAYLLSDSGVVTGQLAYSHKLTLDADLAAQLSQGFVSGQLRDAFDSAKVDLPDDAIVTSLPPGSRWLLASKSDVSAPVYLLLQDVLGDIQVISADTIPIVESPWCDAAGAQGTRDVELSDGDITGWILLGNGQWTMRPPLADDDTVSEVKHVAHVAYDPQASTTSVDLDAPLTSTYDRSSLQIAANVVRASQGETVSNEVLGNGNSGAANQTFTLRRAPLTFLPVPPPEYRRSTLSIKVGNVEWQEVANLVTAGPSDRVYSVTIDHEGRATVTFGDGTHGARLPTGTQNVVATYRVGLGEQGDVSAGTLDIMLSPPPGVKSVTNPIPASEGVNPSTTETIRETVPRSARTGNRVVNLTDHADLAASYPGVQQAVAASVATPRGAFVQVSVAFDATVPEGQQASRCSALAASIRTSQVQPAAPVSVALARTAYFVVSISMRIGPDVTTDDVANDALTALFDRWSATGARIGQDVGATEIEALLQAITGVRGVQVTGLGRVRPKTSPVLALAASSSASAASSGKSVDLVSVPAAAGAAVPGGIVPVTGHLPVISLSGGRVLRAAQARYDSATGATVPAEVLVLEPSDSTSLPTSLTAAQTVYSRGGARLVITGGVST